MKKKERGLYLGIVPTTKDFKITEYTEKTIDKCSTIARYQLKNLTFDVWDNAAANTNSGRFELMPIFSDINIKDKYKSARESFEKVYLTEECGQDDDFEITVKSFLDLMDNPVLSEENIDALTYIAMYSVSTADVYVSNRKPEVDKTTIPLYIILRVDETIMDKLYEKLDNRLLEYFGYFLYCAFGIRYLTELGHEEFMKMTPISIKKSAISEGIMNAVPDYDDETSQLVLDALRVEYEELRKLDPSNKIKIIESDEEVPKDVIYC